MKPQMGMFIIRSNFSNKCYIEATQNLKGTINGTKFKLEAGVHTNRELQKDWRDQGKLNFTIEILDILEYDKDETKTDYTDDLTLLKMIWQEKMSKDCISFYNEKKF